MPAELAMGGICPLVSSDINHWMSECLVCDSVNFEMMSVGHACMHASPLCVCVDVGSLRAIPPGLSLPPSLSPFRYHFERVVFCSSGTSAHEF